MAMARSGASPAQTAASTRKREGGEDEAVEEADERPRDDASLDLVAEALRPPARDRRGGDEPASEHHRDHHDPATRSRRDQFAPAVCDGLHGASIPAATTESEEPMTSPRLPVSSRVDRSANGERAAHVVRVRRADERVPARVRGGP